MNDQAFGRLVAKVVVFALALRRRKRRIDARLARWGTWLKKNTLLGVGFFGFLFLSIYIVARFIKWAWSN